MSVDFEKSLQNSSKASSFHQELDEGEGGPSEGFVLLGFHHATPFVCDVDSSCFKISHDSISTALRSVRKSG